MQSYPASILLLSEAQILSRDVARLDYVHKMKRVLGKYFLYVPGIFI